MRPQKQLAPIDPLSFRRVMGRFATGITVITAEAEGGVRGMTANAFMSASLRPPLCVISVATQARLHAALIATAHFGLSILAQGQEAVSRHFAGQSPEQPEVLFEHIEGVPVLADVCAALAASIVARHDCGDHSLFVGEVIGLRDDGRAPLVYHAGKYATLHYRRVEPAEEPIDFWEIAHE